MQIRDTLFGDLPLSHWPSTAAPAPTGEPWASFVAARSAVETGNTQQALSLWQRIAAMPGLESRHYLQAWHFLRENGVMPPADQHKRLLGVVLEVPMEGGLDLLAAYPEGTARYYNYTGAGVVWERPDASLDAPIRALLNVGQRILNAIGPWTDARPAPPPLGQVRLNFLSPAGLHFGQGSFQVFGGDAMARPVIDAGVALMQALIAKEKQ